MNPSPSGVEPSEKDSELPLLRERIRILEAERAGQNRTLATAGVATFEWDVAGDAVTGNGLLRLFYGLPDRPGGSPIGALHAAIHPDDRGPRAEALRGALSDGGGTRRGTASPGPMGGSAACSRAAMWSEAGTGALRASQRWCWT